MNIEYGVVVDELHDTVEIVVKPLGRHLQGLSDYAGALKRSIINEITTNETLFFRDQSPFDLSRHKILPELIDRRSKTTQKVPLRIWSAACSTGQEIHSAAMVIAELPGDPSRYNIRLVGADISDQAVAQASAGVFSHLEVSRGLMDSARARYFVPHPGGRQIRDELRALVNAGAEKFNHIDIQFSLMLA